MAEPRSRSFRPPLPRYVRHESFDDPKSLRVYGPDPVDDAEAFEAAYMPDEVTRDFARRMHYAAHRAHKARTHADARRWLDRYYRLRDGVVTGNRKLVYQAVRRRMTFTNRADDAIGECHIVLIQAVAAYNPWMGVRFSTYAYTCLVRALSRLSQKFAADWLARSLPLDVLPDGGPGTPREEPTPPGLARVDDFLRADHPLLSPREKTVITRRFCMAEAATVPTLEKVGRTMGLSKERVRQVQACALDKLRKALAGGECA
jgi:RNA polymerase primary sigma factor/RNA polymerase sigma factor